MKIELNRIKDGKDLRSAVDEEAMQDLVNSIGEHGVIVPIKVRQVGDDYEIIYGHRRVEACRKIGITEIEATVEGLDDTETLLQGLIENIQREDLSDMEEGEVFKSIKEETGWTNEQIGKSIGKSRQYIDRRLSLIESSVVMGVAKRSAQSIPDLAAKAQFIKQVEKESPELAKPIAEKVVKEGLTSRQTEHLVNEIKRTLPIGGVKLARDVINKPYEDMGRTVTEEEWDRPKIREPKTTTSEEQAKISFLKGEEFQGEQSALIQTGNWIEFVKKNKDKNLNYAIASLVYMIGLYEKNLERMKNILKECQDAYKGLGVTEK